MKQKNGLPRLGSIKVALIITCLSLVVLACSLTDQILGTAPTATPESTPTLFSPTSAPERSGTLAIGQPAACYPGAWTLKNVGDLVAPILAENKIQALQYTGSTGSLVFTLTAGGSLTIAASQYHSLFSGKLGFIPIMIDALINGSGTAKYSLAQNGSLLISTFDFGGITFSASTASIQIIPAEPVTTLMPVLQGGASGQTYQLNSSCSGDSILLDTGVTGAPPLDFVRIYP